MEQNGKEYRILGRDGGVLGYVYRVAEDRHLVENAAGMCVGIIRGKEFQMPDGHPVRVPVQEYLAEFGK